MKKKQGKRHMPEQIIRKLREADGMIAAGQTIGQVVQSLEISEQTFHRWRNQYGGMKAEQAKRLKKLEQENKRLKKLVADLTLDKDILKEVAPRKLGRRGFRPLGWMKLLIGTLCGLMPIRQSVTGSP
jgi:transposase-like protein